VSPVVAAAPVLTALVAPVSVVGTDGSNASSATVGIAETTPASPSTTAKPVAPQPVAPQSAPQKIKYVVKSGDSFWKIAKKFPGTTEAELVRLNKGKTTIYPGQILWIPR
jgi:LysM repeat protein